MQKGQLTDLVSIQKIKSVQSAFQLNAPGLTFGGKLKLSLPGPALALGGVLIHNVFIKYYTDIVGLDSKYVALVYVIYNIWNAINDPIIGAWLDKLKFRPKRGKYVYIMRVTVPFMIVLLRAMDVPISHVANLLSEDSLDDIHEWLSNKQGEISRKITYLRDLSIQLELLKGKLDRFENTEIIELMKMQPCWVLLTDSIMESGDPELSSKIQQMVRHLNSRQEWLSFCHTISIVSKENLIGGMYHSYLHNGILSTFSIETDAGIFQKLESRYCAKKYVVVNRNRYNGYDGLDHHYEKMKSFINKRGLRIAGNSLEINLYNQYDKHYIEINLPIEEN